MELSIHHATKIRLSKIKVIVKNGENNFYRSFFIDTPEKETFEFAIFSEDANNLIIKKQK